MKKIYTAIQTMVLSVAAVAQTLTIDDCCRMALVNNDRIASAKWREQQTIAMVKSLKANYLPSFNASFTGMYSNAKGGIDIDGGNLPVLAPGADGTITPTGTFAYFPGLRLDYRTGAMFSAGVEVTQPIYMGGKIASSVDIARHTAEMARFNSEMIASEVTVEASKAYADLVRACLMLDVANGYKGVVAELRGNLESAIRHGMRHNNDLMKVKVRENEADLNILKANNGIRLARMNLCRIIGLPIMSDIEVSPKFPEIEMPHGVLDEDMVANRPESMLLAAQSRMLESKVKYAGSEMLPKVGVQAGYYYNHGFELNDSKLFDSGAFMVMLNVTVPIYHFGERTNKVKSERAAWERAESERREKTRLMVLEMHKSYAELEEADAALTMTRNALNQSEENMRLSKVQFDNGMETLGDYLEAQLLWNRAGQHYVEAGFNRYVSYIDYLRTTGQ